MTYYLVPIVNNHYFDGLVTYSEKKIIQLVYFIKQLKSI